jgi:hypothetical protein
MISNTHKPSVEDIGKSYGLWVEIEYYAELSRRDTRSARITCHEVFCFGPLISFPRFRAQRRSPSLSVRHGRVSHSCSGLLKQLHHEGQIAQYLAFLLHHHLPTISLAGHNVHPDIERRLNG